MPSTFDRDSVQWLRLSRAASGTAPALAFAAWAFLRRGVATWLSYRAKLSLGAASLFLSIVTFALVGRVVAAAGPGFSQRYGTDYASFAILGVSVHSVASAGLGCFRSAVRREQLQGTIEALLSGRLPAACVICLAGLGDLALAGLGGACFIALAGLMPGISISVTLAGAAAACLYAVFMAGLGLASAGFILVSKEGEPVSWIFGSASGLLGGVYFPIDLMPHWLQRVALSLPTAHALSLVRGVHASGLDVDASSSIVVLGVAAAAAVAVGLAALSWGLARARRLGTIGEY